MPSDVANDMDTHECNYDRQTCYRTCCRNMDMDTEMDKHGHTHTHHFKDLSDQYQQLVYSRCFDKLGI